MRQRDSSSAQRPVCLKYILHVIAVKHEIAPLFASCRRAGVVAGRSAVPDNLAPLCPWTLFPNFGRFGIGLSCRPKSSKTGEEDHEGQAVPMMRRSSMRRPKRRAERRCKSACAYAVANTCACIEVRRLRCRRWLENGFRPCGVKADFTHFGKSTENGKLGPHNRRLRDECLNVLQLGFPSKTVSYLH